MVRVRGEQLKEPFSVHDNVVDVDRTLNVVGDVTTTGLVDGRDVFGDGTSLDSHVTNTSNPHSVSKSQLGLSNVPNTKVNATTTDPTSNSDDTQGYTIGSRWVNYSTAEEFVCVSAETGNAVWKTTTVDATVKVNATTTNPTVNNDSTEDYAILSRWVNYSTGEEFVCVNADVGVADWKSTTSTGTSDVTGPGSSTDNAITRFDGTTGKVVQNSSATIDDSGNLSVTAVSSGVWSGTEISVAKGGTGQTSYTDGQLLIGNSTGNTLAKATLTAGSSKQSITNGSGTITLDVAEGNITHNNLTGLSTGDVHTQYAILAGRSGSQSLIGGTASGENLTLTSTAHATKGRVIIASHMNFQSFVPYFTQYSNGDSGSSITIDWNNGIKQTITATGTPCVLTFTAPPGPCNVILVITQGSGGSKTFTWPAAVKWVGGAAPTLSTSASAIDIVSFYFDGSSYYGNSSLAFA